MAGVTSVSATIDIVDDDASFRTSTGRLLRACGYAVETYASAEELLKRLPNADEPGCLLLDINMPGVSGPDLQARLNGVASSIPVVFLTGHADIPHHGPGHQGRRRRPPDEAGRRGDALVQAIELGTRP